MKRIELTEEELKEQKVILKPLFGIQPESYIKYIYILLIGAALFLLLFLPGIMKNGTYYRFSSTPQGASVYVDGIRLGSTPGIYFAPKGEREITLKSPFHETVSNTVKVKGRVFASLFIKRMDNYKTDLVFNVDRETLNKIHLEAASWFQSDEGYSSQPLPRVMTAMTRGFYRNIENHSDITDHEIKEFNLTLLRTVTQKQSYREWQESASIYLTRGKALNPGSYLKAVSEGSRFIAENPEVLSILGEFHTLPDLKNSVPKGMRNKQFSASSNGKTYQPDPDDPLRFRPVGFQSAGSEGFDVFAADREITKNWYSLFLNDNPNWSLPSQESLKDQNLVDNKYLSDWDGPIESNRSQEPLRFVSRYGAEAFCKWLNKKYFNSPGMTVRLPNEWEWEELALMNGLNNSDRPSQKNLGPLEAGSFQAGDLKLYDMEGNLWEWCSNGFGANDSQLKSISELMESSLPLPDSAVRGGSWANSSVQVDIRTRGSQPGNWCTAYVGFRPLLIVKRK